MSMLTDHAFRRERIDLGSCNAASRQTRARVRTEERRCTAWSRRRRYKRNGVTGAAKLPCVRMRYGAERTRSTYWSTCSSCSIVGTSASGMRMR